MSDIDQETNEYVDLPDDPEMAFAILQERALAELMRELEGERFRITDPERRYVYKLIAFDDVNNLGILDNFTVPPIGDDPFSEYFLKFSQRVELASQKFKIEAAQRLKTGDRTIVVLDKQTREAIHRLINTIRNKLNELSLTDNKREALFDKLNAFSEEVDRDRTRVEIYLSLVVDTSRALRKSYDELKPLLQTFDRISEIFDKAKKWHEMFPSWEDRKKIEAPRKSLAPPASDFDEEIPF